MKTALEYAKEMAKQGIISDANIIEAERFFLRYMEGFREQLLQDISTKSKEQQSDEYRDYMS